MNDADFLHAMVIKRGEQIAARTGMDRDLANDVAFCVVCREQGIGIAPAPGFEAIGDVVTRVLAGIESGKYQRNAREGT